MRAGQHVLQGQEVGADVLRGAGDVAQDLRDPPQHGDLLLAGAGLAALAAAAQALEQLHRALGRRAHVELADPGQADHLAGRHGADHGVAVVAAGPQVADHRLDVVLHEQHGGDDDVALRDVLAAALQRLGVAAPFGGGVQRQAQSRQIPQQVAAGLLGGAGQMAVQRHDDDAHRGGPVARPLGSCLMRRSGLWHRTASRS